MKPILPGSAKLGFIGIGYMGRPIAQRLLQAGFSVAVFDRHTSNAEKLTPYGGIVAKDIAALAASCDVILSCLANDQAVLDVHLGAQGTLANIRPDSLIIEMSTVSPGTARQVSQHASARSIPVLDVTISGSTPAAETGSLVLFGGGPQGLFEASAPIFRAIARSYFYLGPNGSGATMKLVVNTLLGVGMQAIAEAVALGEKAGLERGRLLAVLAQTAVIAPAHAGKLSRVANGDFSPQFPVRLMNKDLGLILGLAAAVGAEMPAARAAFEVNANRLEQAKEEDFSAVILEMEARDHVLPVEEEHPRSTTASGER